MEFLENQRSFSLKVNKYEYPNAKNSDDANWLEVEIAAADGNVVWDAISSALTTTELVKLKKWFISIIENKHTHSSIYFIENELAFRYEKESLFIILDFLFHPNGSNYDYSSDEEYILKFSLTSVDNIISSIESIITKFPKR